MPKAEIDDGMLLQLLTDDAEQGIVVLQARYGKMIFRVVSRILQGHPQDAEEVASDVLVAAWRQASALLENGRPLGPWLTVTARNRAIDRWRLLSRKVFVPLNEELDFPLQVVASEGEDLIGELVLDLNEPDREIFLRRYYRMETAREIGKVLGIEPHAVNVRLARGRAKLKKEYLKQMGKENGRYVKQHGIS